MNFLFYLFIIFLAIITSSFITIILTTLRVGLYFCKDICNSSEYEKYEIISAMRLKKKYYISLLIDCLIITAITCVVIFLLNKYIVVYFLALAIFVLFSINKTGINNQNNILEFDNALKANYPYNDSASEPEQTVKELMNRSKLSKDICTDVYQILTFFLQSDKDLAYKKIETQLIPHLMAENIMGNVGIAFGMLVNEEGLTQEESKEYSTRTIQEMVRMNNMNH